MRATTIRMEDAVLERVDSMAKSVNRSRLLKKYGTQCMPA